MVVGVGVDGREGERTNVGEEPKEGRPSGALPLSVHVSRSCSSLVLPQVLNSTLADSFIMTDNSEKIKKVR